MKAFADLPISRKLARALMATSTLMIVVTSTAFFVYEYRAAKRGLVESISAVAGITATNSAAVVAFDDRLGAEETLAALAAETGISAAALYDAAGQRLAFYQAKGGDPVTEAPPGPDGIRFEDGRLHCLVPVGEGGRRLGTLFVEAKLTSVYARLRLYGVVMAGVALLAVAIAWLLAQWLQRRIARPILDLATAAQDVTRRGDYAVRVHPQGSDEIGQLTHAFNRMLTQVEESAAARERNAREIQQLNAELEERVRTRTAALEESNRELESFSYSVSHDLRAPLRHIQGFAEMLVRATNGTLPGKAQRYLRIITDASADMAQLIDDLLAFSRMGRTDLRDGCVDLRRLFVEALQHEAAAAADRSIRWEVGPLPPVHGDEAMLRLVVSNLVGNAVKFTRRRETAEITVASAGAEQGRAIIRVRDNGVGFDMAYVEKLFGVFQRLHRAEDFEGTGIGLANVRRIISRHGGRVWAESTPGAGAAFYFTLQPYPDPDTASPPANHESAQTHSPG